ncbi:MAG: bifunctional pyr operon transcriptional regulator/uracil phosphoribosyltransferase PyrR [Clostridia bacterium]|nr:bifunctional pyr operon transcriptional regulator/uracil phosphoribosyltransferase PyrR [Clostridia bacterium]
MEKILADTATMQRMLARLSHEIIERNANLSDVVIVGVLRRGAALADMLRDGIEKITQIKLPVEYLDITLYRDDLEKLSESPRVNGSDIGFDITGKTVIIVDDVIFTGRTVRAAIDALFDLGRPKKIQLAALVDRGHRELPIKPDFVGKNIPTSLDEVIMVKVPQYDGKLEIAIKSI